MKRNVVFIYAEGLERTYFDETLFPGLINKLRVLESKGTYFTKPCSTYPVKEMVDHSLVETFACKVI